MKMLRAVSAGSIALALLVGLIFLGVRGSSRPLQAPRPSSAQTVFPSIELHKLETRFAQIEDKIVQLEQHYRELAKREQTIADQGLPLSENLGDDSLAGDAYNEASDATNSEQAVVQQRVAVIESELASQATDPLWSPEAVEHVRKVFSNESFDGNTLLDVVCATTFCRLEVTHADEGSRDQFMDQIFPTLRWQTEEYSHTIDNHDGSYNSVLYLSREGYSLPPL